MVEHKMKVLFTMPCSFIRSKEGTNPFFDPIIRVCEEQGFQWFVVAPCNASEIGYPSKNFIDGRFLDWGSRIIWQFSKLIHLSKNVQKVYNIAGIFAGSFYGKKLKNCDLIIKVAGQFSEQLQGINPKAKIVDIQHGVIYSRHEGYFDGRGLAKLRFLDRGEIWLYGLGYADCFFKNPENHKWLDGRVKVVGDVLNAGIVSRCDVPNFENRKALVCMLQFNNSYPMKELLKMKELWEQYLETNRYVIEKNNLDVLIRHHPRFGNVVDFSDWGGRFPWAHVDKRSWNEVYDDALCCVGFNSTTVIEAAGRGIPVIILDGSPIGKDSYFAETFVTDEFHYPFQNITLGEWVAYEEDKRSAVAKTLMQWHQRFYTPFDKEICVKLLKGEK